MGFVAKNGYSTIQNRRESNGNSKDFNHTALSTAHKLIDTDYNHFPSGNKSHNR